MRSEIKSLTGLRGAAAICVVLFHYVGFTQSGILFKVASIIVGHFYLAVDLFLILSGFVLTMTYETRLSDGGSSVRQQYFLHRVARIYPLYFVTTVICFIFARFHVGQEFETNPSIAVLAANLLMIQSWGWPGISLNPPGWSISTEWAANVLFPLLVPLLERSNIRQAAWLVGVPLASLACCALLNDHARGVLSDPNFPAQIVRCVSEFMLGMYCYRLKTQTYWPRYLSRNDVLLGVSAAMLCLLLFQRSDFVFVLLACCLIVGLSYENSSVSRALGSFTLHWLGEISYSIYLFHFPLLVVTPWLTAVVSSAGVPHIWAVTTVIMLNLVIGVSAISYYLLEKPMRSWIRYTFEGKPKS